MADWGKRREIKSGGSSPKFMALDLSGYEAEQFKLKLGNNRIEILPYEITTNMHPLVAQNKMKKGEWDYAIILKVHTNVGPGKKTVVCPYPYGKPCPICEAALVAKNAGDEKTNEALYAKTKVYYNVLDNSERDKGVKIFEASVKGFQKPLEVVDQNAEEDFPGRFFADLETGLTVKVLGGEAEFGGHKYIEASSISLVERKESVEEFADKVIPLDKCVKLFTYEELESLMQGVDTEEEDEVSTESVVDRKKVSKPSTTSVVEETASKANTTPIDECPEGHEFGDAFNEDFVECNDCNPKLYAKCAKYGRTLTK